MRYLADILTLSRLIIAIVIFILALTGGAPEVVFILFIIAELTDAFDGTCARKWPFPKNKTPKYRKYAAIFDMVADVALAGFQVIFVILQINQPLGLAIIIYELVSSIGGDLLVYGKILGHPDNCTKNSLASRNFPLAKKIILTRRRNFPLAKKIILTRRYIYTLCIGFVNAVILFATNWPDPVKYGLFAFGCSIFVFAWFFLRQRRQNISRDAVDIEKKLTQKSQRK